MHAGRRLRQAGMGNCRQRRGPRAGLGGVEPCACVHAMCAFVSCAHLTCQGQREPNMQPKVQRVGIDATHACINLAALPELFHSARHDDHACICMRPCATAVALPAQACTCAFARLNTLAWSAPPSASILLSVAPAVTNAPLLEEPDALQDSSTPYSSEACV